MSTLADCPSKRCPGCQLSSMAPSQGDDLAALTATSNILCARDRALGTQGGVPTLVSHCSSQRDIFLLYLKPKRLSLVRINKQHRAGSDDEYFSLPVVLGSNRSQPRDGSRPGLSTAHSSAVPPLAFLCPLHPYPRSVNIPVLLPPHSVLAPAFLLHLCYTFPFLVS